MKDTTIHQARTVAALSDISRHISSSLDYRLVANRCLQSLSENLELAKCGLFMPTRDKKALKLHIGIDWEKKDRDHIIRNMRETPMGRVFSSGMPLAVPDASELPGLYLPEFPNATVVGYIAVPIMINMISIGVLSAYRVSNLTMLDEDVNVMKIVASILSQTLKLEEQVEAAHRRLKEENRILQQELESRFHLDNIVCRSNAMNAVLEMVKKVADTDAIILLRGESGTGKSLLAKGLHFQSRRVNKPLVTVNCAAMPENLIESELFGHEKGAFTGAIQEKSGRFESADGGTLFLDEIGELSLETQAKILRIIQEGTFERLGSNETRQVDVRLICATNADLEHRVRNKSFREDLYYRLMVIPVHVPPLRQRREDILPLVSHFLGRANEKYGKKVEISREGHRRLESNNWPGNIRELEHTIERTVILASTNGGPVVEIPFLENMDCAPLERPLEKPVNNDLASGYVYANEPERKRALYERVPLKMDHVKQALENAAGIQTLAAKNLGVSLRQLRYAVKKFNLDIKFFKT